MRLDGAAMFFGSAFLAIGVAHLLADLGVWTLSAGVLLPTVLIIGGLGLALSAVTERASRT